jgi:C4-dicarboxylate transporter
LNAGIQAPNSPSAMAPFDDMTGRAGETVPPHRIAALDRLERFARLMDTAVRIPGTEIRLGLDSVIGLVPGIGDAVSAAFATWIVAEAARLGVPKHKLARMMANVLIDAGVGAIPIAGDLFDVAFRANARNFEILRDHLRKG